MIILCGETLKKKKKAHLSELQRFGRDCKLKWGKNYDYFD